MSFAQLFSILKARWILAASVLLATVGLVLTVSLIWPQKYMASASVVLDVKSVDPITGAMAVAAMSSSNLATQVDIIESDNVARRVVRMLKLDHDPSMQAQWEEDTDRRGEFEGWLAKWLQAGLSVKPSTKESSVIDIRASYASAKLAAAVADAFVRAYIDTTLELRVEPAKQYSAYFDQRLKQARADLQAAATRLSEFQKDNGIVGDDERLDVETARLNDLSGQLVMLHSVTAEAAGRARESKRSANEMADVVGNPLVASLRVELVKQESQLEQLSSRLGEKHPSVLELQANVDSVKAKLADAMKTMTSGVGLMSTLSQAREADIQAAFDAQRDKVLKLKAQRDSMSLLIKEVESAQRAYDAVFARLTQSSLESQNTQTNVAVLNSATEPIEPSSPRPFLYTLIAFFVGCALAIFAVLLREILDKRVRTSDDLVQAFDLPVLGFIPRTNTPGLLRRNQIPWVQQHVMAQLPRPKGN